MKVTMLKAVPPYMPGQEVELDDALAKQLVADKKALSAEEAQKAQADNADVSKLSMAQMQARGLKNVASEDAAHYARAESAAIAGVPLAHGDAEMTVTGGVTPPTKVFPAVAKAQGALYEEVSAPKADKKDDKKAK